MYRMGENIWKSYIWKGIKIQNIKRTPTYQQQKKKKSNNVI